MFELFKLLRQKEISSQVTHHRMLPKNLKFSKKAAVYKKHKRQLLFFFEYFLNNRKNFIYLLFPSNFIDFDI